MIYWDHNSTTPCATSVVAAMQPFWTKDFGNASSSHLPGLKANNAISAARVQVSALSNCLPDEIFFTSGATESNNLVFLGLLLSKNSKRRKVVVSAVEHKSVMGPAALLAEKGFEVIHVPVNSDCAIDLEAASALITSDTLLVSAQVANNEIGTIQPVAEIARIAHEAGALFHTDAAQALGKIPVDLGAWDCDFSSFSAHKLYGPKGSGALYVKGGAHAWPWSYPLRGGSQEGGLRPGTNNTAVIVGFGEACHQAMSEMPGEKERLSALSAMFIELLKLEFPNCMIHAELAPRLPGTVSVAFPGIPADVLIANSGDYCVARGSACDDGALGFSHVLKQITCNEAELESTIRISFGVDSSADQFDGFFAIVRNLYNKVVQLG